LGLDGTLAFELKTTPIFPALDQFFYILEACFASIEYNDFDASIVVQCNKFNRALFSTDYATLLIQACIDAHAYQLDNLYELDDIDIIYSKNIKPKRRLPVVHKLFDNSWKSTTVHILETKFQDYFVKLNTLASQLLPIQDVILYQYLNTFLLKQIMDIMDFMKRNNMVFSKYYYTLLFNYHNDIFAELYKTTEPIITTISTTNSQKTVPADTDYNLTYIDSIINNVTKTIALLPPDINIEPVFKNIRSKTIINHPAYKSLNPKPDPEFFELIRLVYKHNPASLLHIGQHSSDILNVLLADKSSSQLSWKVIESVRKLKTDTGTAVFKSFYKYPENYLTNGNITQLDNYKTYLSQLKQFNPALITNFTCDTDCLVNDWFNLGLIMHIAVKQKTDCIIRARFTQQTIQHLLHLITCYKACFTDITLILPTTTDTTKRTFYLICYKYKGNPGLLKKLDVYIAGNNDGIDTNGAGFYKNMKPNPLVVQQFSMFIDKMIDKTIKTVNYMQFILDCLLDKKYSYIRKKTYCSDLIKPYLESSTSSKTQRASIKYGRVLSKKNSIIANKLSNPADEALNIYDTYLDRIYSKLYFTPALQHKLINNLLHLNTKSAKYDTSLCIVNVQVTLDEIEIYIANEGNIPNDTRKDSIKNFVTGLIQHYKSLEVRPIISTCILIWISDHAIWNQYEAQGYDELLPICTYACQRNELYLLIPDSQFTNLSVHNRYYDGFINWDNQLAFFDDQPAEKNDIIFFRGADTTRDNHNLRIALMRKIDQDTPFKQNMIYEILTKLNYEPPWNFLNHRFLLNLPGQYPWSTRQKYNYLSRAFIINVRVTTHGDAHDKHFNSFIDIFVPDELCHNIDMKYFYYDSSKKKDAERQAKYNLLNKMQASSVYHQIKQIYSKYKSHNPLTNTKVKEACRRAKLITNTNIIYYFAQIIKRNNMIGLKPVTVDTGF
jgi:hypothetical protein